MGLLDDVGKMAGLAGMVGGGSPNAALLNGVMGLLGGGSGLASILSGFQKSGLGDVAASWVGTGQNASISPDQLLKGLGSSHVSQLAKQAGMSEGDAASALAGLLPSVIDKLTPNGAVPHESELPGMLGALKGLLG